MSGLEVTGNTLAALKANQYFGFGEHLEESVRVGGPGKQVGSTFYDPVAHDPADIDPLSVFGMAVGQEQVRLVQPNRPLLINVITDCSSAPEHSSVAHIRQRLAEDVHQAIEEIIPGMGDVLRSYAVGDSIPDDLDGYSVTEVRTDSLEETTDEIAEITERGLTFVIGGFSRLRLPLETKSDIVAIKVNHPWDRELPANIDDVVIDGNRKVNTNKRKELAQANEALRQRHEQIVAILRASGAGVASVIARPRLVEGYDVEAADIEISEAIEDSVGL